MRLLIRVILASYAAAIGALVPAAYADWMNLTGAETAPNIAEISVLDNRVEVLLEIYIGDLDTFADLIPDDLRKDAGEGRPSESERMAHFSNRVFTILGSDDEPLPAELKLVEPRLRVDRKSPFAGMINPQTRRPVPGPPADKRVLYAELDYPFEGQPETLTFSPPKDARGNPAVSIGFIAYHKTVPIIDFRYLGGDAVVTLDWNDPWYSAFENPILKRHHKDALMSFLYVEPREVRHEVLVRVRDLQDWTDLGLRGSAIIGPDAQARVKDRARAFFEARNPLRIEGMPFKPASSRAEFLNISLTGLQVIEEDKPLELSTAIIGVILSYPVEQLPQNVTVAWELFNERTVRIPTTAIDPAGPLMSFIDADNPTIEWKNFLKTYVEPKVAPVEIDAGGSFDVPVASLGLLLGSLLAAGLAARPSYLPRVAWGAASLCCVVGAILLLRVTVVDVVNPFAGPPDEPLSARIITAVLGNLHTAFLERTEPELRQALSVVVAEEGFADIEAELSRALTIQIAGGGIARINSVEDLVVKDLAALEGRTGFRSLAEWTALASAAHWGHAHRRRIRFRALMELEEIAGSWKLTGMTVVDVRQET